MATNLLRPNPNIAEITGKPGTLWGPIPVPTSGTIAVKITGDTLQATVQSGLGKSNTKVRIQNLDTVQIIESPNYLLLVVAILIAFLGGSGVSNSFDNFDYSGFIATAFGVLLFGGIAAAGFLLFFHTLKHPNRLITFYSPCCTIPIFMTKPADLYQQFADNVLTLSRQLNARSTPVQAQPTQQRPTQPKATANHAS